MKVTVQLDWLTFSLSKDEADGQFGERHELRVAHEGICQEVAGIDTTFVARAGMHGYSIAYENTYGIVVGWNRPIQANGMFVSFPGSALSEIDGEETSARLLGKGWGATRIDIACDLHGEDVDLTRYYNAMKEGLAQTKARKFRLMQSETGATLYIGSRKSDRFLRIYDKGGKEDQNNAWFRAELEVKGGVATPALRWLLTRGLEEIPSLINAFASFPFPQWERWMGSRVELVKLSERNRDGTRKWLLRSVAGALAREIEKDPDFAERFISAVESRLSSKFRETIGLS